MPAAASPDRLVLLDFDRTIFDTHSYYHDFLEMVGESYGAEFARNLQAAERSGEYFDPFAYFLTQGVDSESAQAAFRQYYQSKYHAAPESGRYLFAGVLEFLDALRQRTGTKVGIITTGTPQSQEFKLSLCPQLDALPREILTENKGLHIRRDLDAHHAIIYDGTAYARFTLIDDREDVLDQIAPHPDHRLIHIHRPGSKYQPTGRRTDIFQITSLDKALAIC